MARVCLICSEESLKTIEGFSDLPRVTSDAKPFRAGGKLSACLRCGTVQKLPDQTFLDEIDEIYSSYSLYDLARGAEQVVFVNGRPQRRSELLVDLLLSVATPDTVIDVGCGNGAALRTFSEKLPGAKLWGAELSDRNEPRLRDIPNFQSLFSTSIRDISRRFDAVTSIHVLEHVLDPVQFLSDCAGLLGTDGVMLVEVPDVETSPFDLIIADHLTHFSVRTLDRALCKAGLEPLMLNNRVLPKEVTTIVRTGATIDHGGGEADDGFKMASDTVRWIGSVLAQARAMPSDRAIGIFGTSMAGMWLFGAIRERVSFFVDEDQSKIGNTVDGIPVVHPSDAPRNTRIFVPLGEPVANAIVRRWSAPDREYIAPKANLDTSMWRAA